MKKTSEHSDINFDALPKHLGGHANITHVDEGALKYLIKRFNPETMLDIGCGVGGMLLMAKEKGLAVIGVDGDFTAKRKPEVKDEIFIHDYNTGTMNFDVYFDIGWSVEFLEHIDEKYLPNVFDTFNKCKIVFCTANPYRNKYHLNPQPVTYWVEKFKENGFEFLHDQTREVRTYSTMNRDFVRKTGMIFKNLNI